MEGAAQNAAVVEHFAVELAARDGRRLAHKDVALHRRTISDGAEIEQPAGLVAARQKQHVAIGRVIFNVLPAVALAGIFAAVGILRPAVLHDEVGAGDRFVQHHVLVVRHGKGHGRLVVFIGVVAFVDGLAVQAENFGAGNDGHGGVFVRVEVPCRVGRHGSRRFIHLQRVFAVHLEHTAIRYGDVVGIGQPRLAVEHAAGHVAVGRAGHLKQARREGAAGDGAADLIEHYVPEHAVLDGAAFVQDSAGHGFEGAGLFRWGRILEVVGPLLQNQGSSVEDIPSVTLAGFVSIVGLVVHMLQIHRAVCIHQQAGTERLIVCRQGQLAAGDIGHERERLFAGQVHCATVIVPKFDAFRRDGPAHKVLGLILRGHFHLAADEHTTAAFGRFAAFDFAVRNFQFSRAVQHHVLVRHGEGHDIIAAAVAALAVAIADGLAVQAEDFGVGGDDYFRQRISVDYNVGLPIRRHIVDFRDLGIGVGRIPGDGVETSYPGYGCVPVEHAASHVAVVPRQARREDSAKDLSYAAVFYLDREDAVLDDAGVCHTARALEGSTSDVSRGVVYHGSLKGAFAIDGAVVCHTAPVLEGATTDGLVVCHTAPVLEGATTDGLVVCHAARKGAVLYGAAVCHGSREFAVLDGALVFHFFIRGEGAVLYGAVVCHGSIEVAVIDCSVGVVFHTATACEGSVSDFSSGVVYHCSIEGAAADRCAVAVCHTARVLEGTTADGAVVCHFSLKGAFLDGVVVCHTAREGAAANCRTRFNRTFHSRSGLRSGLVLGMGGAEIKRSIIQSQCIGAAIVIPAVATGAVRTVRQTVLHDELWGVCCKGPQGEHGEHHAQCQDQAENAFFHWGRPPLLPKAARSFVSGSIIPEKQPEGKQSRVKRPENCANDDFCPLDRAKNAGWVSLLWPFAAG